MRQTRVFSSVLVGLLVLALFANSQVVTADLFDSTSGTSNAASSADDSEVESSDETTVEKKKGNSFARALTAPFRAIGKLFGGGKKDDNKIARISDKEANKFESARMTRVKDAAVVIPAETDKKNAAALPQSEFESHLQKGRSLLVSGDVNGAIGELIIASSIKPNSGELNKLLGIAYESKGLRERALKAFEAALKSDENNAEHLNNLGFLL
jgi:tetratricopeptide (TPR) repeat protein